MMKQTPSSVTVRVKPKSAHSLQVRRGLSLKRPNAENSQGPPGKNQPSQRHDKYYVKVLPSPTIIIQRQEMASYFKIFDDDFIQDFLWMDRCCKMTDKYLLAMAFVYFKRARFSLAEYTRKNFFMALYLANTMEEDEEENKYEIFPWALGKHWRKNFPRFLKQRDRLWARIEYRAAVSRRCCEEVMAIVPCHFVWLRERLEHHSGAQRQYSHKDHISVPRGPTASPVSCAFCSCSSKLDQSLSLVSSHQNPSAKATNPSILLPATSSLRMATPQTELDRLISECSSCEFVKGFHSKYLKLFELK
ncbi:speedy protein A [Eucyclogobius newberryi]|uniref:speedy protein A n=1 Tax=Eucyclogobius newberryi TaxID=166745 RepID=UPI003B5AE49E